jgi:hypothetical protein
MMPSSMSSGLPAAAAMISAVFSARTSGLATTWSNESLRSRSAAACACRMPSSFKGTFVRP